MICSSCERATGGLWSAVKKDGVVISDRTLLSGCVDCLIDKFKDTYANALGCVMDNRQYEITEGKDGKWTIYNPEREVVSTEDAMSDPNLLELWRAFAWIRVKSRPDMAYYAVIYPTHSRIEQPSRADLIRLAEGTADIGRNQAVWIYCPVDMPDEGEEKPHGYKSTHNVWMARTILKLPVKGETGVDTVNELVASDKLPDTVRYMLGVME